MTATLARRSAANRSTVGASSHTLRRARHGRRFLCRKDIIPLTEYDATVLGKPSGSRDSSGKSSRSGVKMKTRLTVCSTCLEEIESKLIELLPSVDGKRQERAKVSEALCFVRQARRAVSDAQTRIDGMVDSGNGSRLKIANNIWQRLESDTG
jgi:hypothetical protein